MTEVNYTAMFVSALVYFAGGALWYSGALFGKVWMELVGLTREKLETERKENWKPFLTSIISALLISYAIGRLIDYTSVRTVTGALHLAFWSWLCFVMTTSLTNSIFAGRPIKLVLIDGGYHLYGFLVAAVIQTVWV